MSPGTNFQLFFSLIIIINLALPTYGFLRFDLTDDEQEDQVGLVENSMDELIHQCSNGEDDSGQLTYDYKSDDCIANDVTLRDNNTADLYRLKRQELLAESQEIASGFLRRLSWPRPEFVIQIAAFSFAGVCGIFLWVVGHYDIRSHLVQFFKDPSDGMSPFVYAAKWANFYTDYMPEPDRNDPDFDTFIIEESDNWSTVHSESSEDEKPVPINVPRHTGEEIELTPEELAYIRKNAEFDEWGYPFHFMEEDAHGDEVIVEEFEDRIDKINAKIRADELARMKAPYYWIVAMRQEERRMRRLLKSYESMDEEWRAIYELADEINSHFSDDSSDDALFNILMTIPTKSSSSPPTSSIDSLDDDDDDDDFEYDYGYAESMVSSAPDV